MHELRTYYDIANANGMIPQLELLFAELARIQMQVNKLNQAARAAGVYIDVQEALDGDIEEICRAIPSIGRSIKELSEEYLDVLDEIADTGVVICDVDMGLVGFYMLLGGQEILLSWQYGEPEVLHWHGVADNPDDRRELSELFSQGRGCARLH
jgi:hypothetical protein